MTQTQRRAHVLAEENHVVAKKLRASPGRWFLVAIGELDEARTLTQTAWRIRQNYRVNQRGRRQGLSAFSEDDRGYFEATASADQQRPDQAAPAELWARWVPHADIAEDAS